MCLGSVGPTKGESKPVPHGGQAKVGTFRGPAEARWGRALKTGGSDALQGTKTT